MSSPPPKPRPYRRYLTSALHSRFVNAALLAVVNGLGVAFWTGQDYFWSWFPVGPAGLKAVLFSTCSIFVFILQLATLTVGQRTSASPYTFLRSTLLNFSTYQTLLWYVVSAYWFCEVYIWSVPEHKQLGWVIKGDASTPDRLNERPIYLKFFFLVLATVQSGIHVYWNHSALHIPVAKAATPQANDPRTHTIEPFTVDLQRRLPHIGKHALTCSAIATITSPFLYRALARNFFWHFHLFCAKVLYDLPSSDAEAPDTYFIGTIMGAAFSVGFVLGLMWELSAYCFLRFLKQEPLKNGLPLSAASKDPNGTLMSGLMAKRDVVRTFAFWELAIIAQKFPDRRKAIFTDIERPDGPIWTSMHKTALSVISSIDRAIQGPEKKAVLEPVGQEITTLPRLTKDLRRDRIAAAMPAPTSRTGKLEDFLQYGAKAVGQSQDPWRPPIEKTRQDLIDLAKVEIEQNKGLVAQVMTFLPTGFVDRFFGPRAATKIVGSILGAPVGNAAIVVDAIDSVTKMLIASLNEDTYGKVVHTVPDTVKQFTSTILAVEQVIDANALSLKPHDEFELWEILVIVERLKLGLRELLSAFQIFLNDVGLGIKELNEAKKAAEERRLLPREQEAPRLPESKAPEMEQIRDQPQPQPRQLGPSGTDQQQTIQGKQPRRLEASKQQQRQSNGNVFGARDFNSQPARHRES